MSLTLRYAARSDRGLIREGNEDSVYAGPRLLAVADGMGGMAAGEVASNIVVGALAPLDEDVSSSDLVDALRGAIGHANQTLRDAVESNPALEGMGTTLTAMLFSGNRIALVHVGDSRAYVMREGELTQITRDDTYVQMLVDEGRITADEATTHPQRSLLTRALDGRDVDPDFSVREARSGDRYLLCSDGLSGVVSPETMADALRLVDPREAADRLISLALRGGGPDNITCIVADIVDTGLGDAAPVVGGAAAHDRGRTSSASSDSAAGRAALARPQQQQPPVEEEDDEDTRPPRRPVLTAIVILVVLAVLGAAGFFGWRYTQQQYYVGSNNGKVTVFRGVAGSLAGISFSKVDSESDIYTADLKQVSQRSVEQTIAAKNRADANDIVERLRNDQLPNCEDPTPGPTPSPVPAPSHSPLPNTATPSGSPAPRVSASPGASASPGPSEVPQPGVDCRKPR
ncbi:MAG: protein phosphatase [Actinomycetia bacterium]|nr:protein phosphatase [Actinomycetes bacterium]MDQ1652387.1 family protein phosphatase [Cryptosporangiaceae bacterium]MDQ1657743.1 family protein phosphatase [Cryptosporangiaceae bacterium]